MPHLILNTLVRVLLIFLPFALLSFGKDAGLEQSTSFLVYGGILIIMLLGSLILGSKWWREKRSRLESLRD